MRLPKGYQTPTRFGHITNTADKYHGSRQLEWRDPPLHVGLAGDVPSMLLGALSGLCLYDQKTMQKRALFNRATIEHAFLLKIDLTPVCALILPE